MSSKDDRLMSIDDLSEYLGIKPSTIYGWRYKGAGPPAIKVGRHLRYRRSAVDKWLDEQGDAKA